ncbi:MAG: HsdR family type I site-specific deoxyribonuclease [Neisseria sp.]|nr:HsdR family type I site-specific deoxyribonuclease [Neisseria sp.]
MEFANENEFEAAFIKALQQHGWEEPVLEYQNEAQLLQNWADILFHNNRQIDRLNGVPLTDGEMAQLIEQIRTKTPAALNRIINGKTIAITRDNPADTLNFGREVSLKIYDRNEIAAGSSRYQIVRQPVFSVSDSLLGSRRGDILLLINGMPVIHIELKRSGVPLSQAVNQIEKYSRNGVFGGLFALVQIFVAATPEDALYFANQPMADGGFNRSFVFRWADFDNEPVVRFEEVTASLLSIPLAHEMIGFYTVADEGDGALKVMRSYQYFAASNIAHRVRRHLWGAGNQRGGYIWHTTGSGKTMTSFKSAQLIAQSGDADKVVFLMDRIELDVQSVKEYRNFADSRDEVQSTQNTAALFAKLKSNSPSDTLIVTSIQKMSNIKGEEGVNAEDIAAVAAKKIVFIVDECHRSTFGEMMADIKETFADALFFGFTGTPILQENRRKSSTTSDIFGDELHRYSLADGIRDGNVLGFDVYRVATFKDGDLRRAVALQKAKAATLDEVWQDEQKAEVFRQFSDGKCVPMAGFFDEKGKYHKGIEDYLPAAQFDSERHRAAVVADIAEHWAALSQGGLFHAMLATSSIREAIEYYRLIKKRLPMLKISALFDTNEGNEDDYAFKEAGVLEILRDYNERYGQQFTLPAWGAFKKDVAARLAHKDQYKRLDYRKTPEKCLDLLIVVEQMLTGFDSKFVNTLYADKLMENEKIIQAFSRTNRLFGTQKPFGTVRYYRKVHTMQRNVAAAVKLFSGDKEFALFADKLPANIRKINAVYAEISELFAGEKIENFAKLPEKAAEKAQFAKLFNQLNALLEAARVQGMRWGVNEYGEDGGKAVREIDEQGYLTLLQRYKELSDGNGGGGGGGDDIPFDLQSHISSIDTGRIDSDYMNSQFEKFLKLPLTAEHETERRAVLNQLHKSFAALSQDEQKAARLVLGQLENGGLNIQQGKTLRDYITEQLVEHQNSATTAFAERFGLDASTLAALLADHPTEQNLNEYNRFDTLLATADMDKAQQYFAEQGESLPRPLVKVRVYNVVKAFVLEQGRL